METSRSRSLWRACRGLVSPKRWKREGGFSVAEVTTVLTALSILSAAAAPSVSDYVEEAKLIRARQDVGAIALGVVRLINDVGRERMADEGWAAYDVLVGSGTVPVTRGAGTESWAAVDGDAVGALDDHLITNAAGYTPRMHGTTFGWRGAYLQQTVQSDPWGNRYAVNVRAMRSHNFDTLVLSAGPDGVVESKFELDGLTVTADDISSLVATSGLGLGSN